MVKSKILSLAAILLSIAVVSAPPLRGQTTRFVFSIGDVGDVGDHDFDGISDLSVAGRILGSVSGLMLYPVQTVERGSALLGIGDIDSDGIPEVLRRPQGTTVEAWSPATGQIFWTAQLELGGLQILSDRNGDGVQEIMARPWFPASIPLPAVFDGATGAVIQTLPVNITREIDDVSGDGTRDFLAGNAVLSGASLLTLRDFPPLMGSPPAYFSSQICILLPDMNGDGTRDILFSESGMYAPPILSVRSGLDGSYLTSTTEHPGIGWTQVLNDLDGDGRDDILAMLGGVPCILSSATLDVVAARPPTPLGNFFALGSSAVVLGDTNGDGLSEFALGSRDFSARLYDGAEIGTATNLGGGTVTTNRADFVGTYRTAPAIGANFYYSATSPYASASAWLMGSVATPMSPPFVIQNQSVWVDPARASILALSYMDVQGNLLASLTVPNDPALVGVNVNLQLLVVDNASPSTWSVSDGLGIRIGPGFQ